MHLPIATALKMPPNGYRRSQRWYHDRESYEHPSFPVAVLGHVTDYRLKRLRVAVVVVLVDELDASEAAQVVERLLERQSEAAAKLSDEDERPLHFVCYVVCHNSLRFVISATKLLIFFAERITFFAKILGI